MTQQTQTWEPDWVLTEAEELENLKTAYDQQVKVLDNTLVSAQAVDTKIVAASAYIAAIIVGLLAGILAVLGTPPAHMIAILTTLALTTAYFTVIFIWLCLLSVTKGYNPPGFEVQNLYKVPTMYGKSEQVFLMKLLVALQKSVAKNRDTTDEKSKGFTTCLHLITWSPIFILTVLGVVLWRGL